MNPRQKVHAMLLISEIIFILSILALSIIGNVKNPKKTEKFWFLSKILTIKQMIIDNINNTCLIENLFFEEENKNMNYERNYSFFLQHSTKDECEINYKKCGILDSMGNIMCIPYLEDCPINKIQLNFESDYQRCTFINYILYYTNKKINDNIVVKLIISDQQPKYITEENFIFDYKNYNNEYMRKCISCHDDSNDRNGDYYDNDWYRDDDSGDWDNDSGDWDLGGGDGDWRRLEIYGDKDITEYILKKMEEKNNIDNNFKKINDEIYYRNYIGFDSYDEIDKFINFNFTKTYITVFPNDVSIIFGYIGLIPFGIIIFFFYI